MLLYNSVNIEKGTVLKKMSVVIGIDVGGSTTKIVGFDENTPDLMDLQMAGWSELLEAAPRLGYDINDYIIPDEEEQP